MSDNKLILKNTLFLAVRMPLALTIGLYTSRVVLQQLGEVDFGIYSVIAGVVVLIGFFNSAISSSINRFMSVEIAKKSDGGIQRVFAASCLCILLIAVVFLIFAETVGLWFVQNKLSIPPDRIKSALTVYQVALLVVIVEFFRQPYHVLIISHERMSFYAYNSIIEALLKLTVAMCLTFVGGNRIVIYIWLLVATAVAINASFVIYCHRHFRGIHFSLRSPIRTIREIFSFIGWNALTSVSDLCYQQGGAIILNMFYGVTLNATMGITTQVKQAVTAFTRNVQIAATPQIIKSFAADQINDFLALFMRISRISFYLVLFFGTPILMNTEFLLSVWLTELPPDVVVFVRLMVAFCIIDSLTGPLWTTMQASGRLRNYQIIISLAWFAFLPLIYMTYSCGAAARWLIILQIIIVAVLLVVRVLFTAFHCQMPLRMYAADVVWPITKVSIVTLTVTYTVSTFFTGAACFFISSTVSCVVCLLSIYYLGLLSSERPALIRAIKKKLHIS